MELELEVLNLKECGFKGDPRMEMTLRQHKHFIGATNAATALQNGCVAHIAQLVFDDKPATEKNSMIFSFANLTIEQRRKLRGPLWLLCEVTRPTCYSMMHGMKGGHLVVQPRGDKHADLDSAIIFTVNNEFGTCHVVDITYNDDGIPDGISKGRPIILDDAQEMIGEANLYDTLLYPTGDRGLKEKVKLTFSPTWYALLSLKDGDVVEASLMLFHSILSILLPEAVQYATDAAIMNGRDPKALKM